MKNKLTNTYTFIPSEENVNEFISQNKNTITILKAIEPHLTRHFPDSQFSLELCNNLGWTTEQTAVKCLCK